MSPQMSLRFFMIEEGEVRMIDALKASVSTLQSSAVKHFLGSESEESWRTIAVASEPIIGQALDS